jgi:hypothetical protein
VLDFNGDGHLDLFSGEMRLGGGNPDARIRIMLGDGHGHFIHHVVAKGLGTHESRIADLDGDGDYDILSKPYQWEAPRLDIFINESEPPAGTSMKLEGIPAFRPVVIDPDGPVRPWGKCTGDLDQDGRTDLIIGGYTRGGLVYYAHPGWEKHIISDEAGFSTDIEVYDIDRDGDLDLFCVRENTLEWFRNPDWVSYVIDSVECHDLELGDFDNDGLMDLVGRNQGEFGQRGDMLFFYRQVTPWSWQGTRVPCPDGEGLKVSDLDGDHDPDVIVNGVWFRNTGEWNGWKETPFTDTWSFRNTYIDAGDVNGDGRKDIVMTPSELQGMVYHISWFEAPPDPGTIWEEHIIDNPVEAVHHFVGLEDFDGDGSPDVATAEMLQGEDPDEVKIYYSRDGGTRWEKQVLGNTGCHSMRIVDVDGDGDPDLFGANHNDTVIRLWLNQGQ